MGLNWVQFRAMVRKDWLQMTAEKMKLFWELLFSVGYGALIGYQLYVQMDNEDVRGLGFLILILCCPIIFQQATSYVANQMVKDRETKMKESLKIMGLQSWIYALSFMFQRGIWITIPTFIVCLFIWIFNSDVYDTGTCAALFVMLWFFAMGMLAFTMFVQNFFKDSKLVTMVLPFLFFIPTGVAMTIVLGPVLSLETNDWIQYLYWFPQFPFTTLMVNLLDDTGLEYFTASDGVSWFFLIIQAPLWFFLHLYMEAIMPDNYGIQQHPCFCFRKCRKQVANQDLNQTAELEEITSQENKGQEPEVNTFKRIGTEKFNAQDPIQLKRVTMKFGDFTAVDQMSLSVQQNEILALLGHNGAGKTTAIYMLTGMLQMTKGDAVLYGKSVRKEIDEVRQDIGLCQQLDVLYDLLSVKEHLRMTMRVRLGVKDVKNEEVQINDILTRCQLHEHKNKLVKQCSGGMKRKLSLGMALIGQTRTIILDEPTSGLDVESREQMWDLIRTLKEGRSIIMSTQHIEEADELADRVCIMSHGKIIGLDTPNEIKRNFGVGYNIFCEVKHEYESQMDEESMKVAFDKVRGIFFRNEELRGIGESQDSNSKKLIIQVPITLYKYMADMIADVESQVPQVQIDLEVNSLEDAFLQIAEADIKKEEEKQGESSYKPLQDEEQVFKEYFQHEGKQSWYQKIFVVISHRLKLFRRSSQQILALIIPLLFVSMMCFIFYSIIRSVVEDPETLDEAVPLILKIFFGFFLTIGYTFTAGLSALTPMTERKGGLRHMMHLFGLNSFQYFFGILIADWIIVLIPATLASVVLLAFDEIMERDMVWQFWILFMFFGLAINCYTYIFSHIFSDPESGIKYISLIYSLGLFIGPMVASSIFFAAIGAEDNIEDAFSFWFFFSPLITFALTTQNICYEGNENIEDSKFEVSGGATATMPMAVGVFSYQALIVFTIVVLIDHRIRNGYKKRGGKDGELPPHLEVHQDVKDHEEAVRRAAGKKSGDPDYFQIRAENLCKTYPGAKRMSVCRNTFGCKEGEVYGLLGPNGAGKSTTFSQMAMQIPITSGTGELMTYEINDLPLAELGKFFGICNQENLMWEDMTVDESLNLVAALKGIPTGLREKFKQLITQNLDLTPFKNTLAKNLSGGNKRKLCCAQAIMLSPRVLFLDEPTTGVDPVSRRSLNRMIKKMKLASVLLTTHRMDEAEQLCDKIAIMINGRFVVFGSPNYLKTQYGHGYTLTIKQTKEQFEDPNQNIIQVMQTLIPEARLVHSEGGQLPDGSINPDAPPIAQAATASKVIETRFKVLGVNTASEDGRPSLSLADTFRKLAQLQEREAIKDFALTRTTMGQVFTDFAKFQINAAAQGDAGNAAQNQTNAQS